MLEAVDRMPLRTPYEEGLRLRHARQYRPAIEQFERALTDPAYHLRACGQIGLCYKALGEPQKAIAAFRRAFADQSASPRLHLRVRYLLGRTLEGLGDTREAIRQYRTISRADGAFKDVSIRLSHLEAHGRAEASRPSLPTYLGLAWKQLQHLVRLRT